MSVCHALPASGVDSQPHTPLSIGNDALAVLMRYGWPGNVRQLAGVLFRAALQCDYDYCYIVGASIAVMGADGGGLVNLTDGSAEDGEPSWGRSVGGSMTATALKGGSRTARVGRTERAPRVRLDARRTGVDAKGMRRAVRVPADSRPTR